MIFQKNVWIDTTAMIEIAKKFIEVKKNKFGDIRVLMTLDNLTAHCAEDVKRVYEEGNVLLCYFPKETTGSLQMIDAGHGRSMCCSVGRCLDKWLMKEENMCKWEGKMTASERRVLINNLVSRANDEALNNDTMRIGCFVRTGALMTHKKSDKDLLIKPQGVFSRINVP